MSISPSGSYNPRAEEPNCFTSLSGTTSSISFFNLILIILTPKTQFCELTSQKGLQRYIDRTKKFSYGISREGLESTQSSCSSKDMISLEHTSNLESQP